jgi:ethanolamine utilization protein EutM
LSEALGLLETTGLTATLVAVDVMEKATGVRLIQCELNDFHGVVTKLTGPVAAVATAIAAGRAAAEPMNGQPIATVIPRSDAEAMRATISPQEYNPLIQQDVVLFPNYQAAGNETLPAAMESDMSQDTSFALGLIETGSSPNRVGKNRV